MRRFVSALGLALFSMAVFAQDGEQIILDPSFESNSGITTLAICTIIKNGTCVSGTDLIRDENTGIGAARSGERYVQLGGRGTSQSSFLAKVVTIPAGVVAAALSFQLQIVTRDSARNAYDFLEVEIRDEHGTLLESLATYSNLDISAGYVGWDFDVARYRGRTVQIFFTSVEDRSRPTWFLLDDLTLTVRSSQ